MGTRNLTMVQLDGEIVVAQYGQWDGYPECTGMQIAAFVDKMDEAHFRGQLAKCRFISDEERAAAYAPFTDSGGWMTMEQSEAFQKSEWGYLSRDVGADILTVIHDNEREELGLTDMSSFAADSLFCEWAYVVNMDTRQLEIYEGFNKVPLEPHDRFYNVEVADDRLKDGYYPVRLAARIPFGDTAPSLREWIEERSREGAEFA